MCEFFVSNIYFFESPTFFDFSFRRVKTIFSTKVSKKRFVMFFGVLCMKKKFLKVEEKYAKKFIIKSFERLKTYFKKS